MDVCHRDVADAGDAPGYNDFLLQPFVNCAYRNVVAPDNGADWQARFQMQFMFTK